LSSDLARATGTARIRAPLRPGAAGHRRPCAWLRLPVIRGADRRLAQVEL